MEPDVRLQTAQELFEQSQRLLGEFIERELQLGFTFAEFALAERDMGNVEHFRKAKTDAQAAANSVRRFLNRITNKATRVESAGRCAVLEQRVAALEFDEAARI